MKILAINGSPREGWNTHTLLEEALKGASSKGAETECISLYSLNYKGCLSCLECKRKNSPELGRCAVKDELRPVLDKIHQAGAVILGSPIYLDEVSSSMRALIERLIFQHISYRREGTSFFERRMSVGLIYTMNISENYLEKAGYTGKFKNYAALFERFIGPVEMLISTETLQAADYASYELSIFDEAARKERREKVFPKDCAKAFEMGAALALKNA